jgi:predicted anti-sigma-YlaC factor YlaD
MAQPARRHAAEQAEESPVDPEAVDRAYHYHRARRNARVRRKREKAHARLRFYLTFAVLAGLAVFLLLTIWNQVQKVFGL